MFNADDLELISECPLPALTVDIGQNDSYSFETQESCKNPPGPLTERLTSRFPRNEQEQIKVLKLFLILIYSLNLFYFN